MQIVPPARVLELTEKILQAARKDPAWWSNHLKKAKDGEPLPYDARLGLTEFEYDEYLSLTGKYTLVKVKTATLRVKGDGKQFVLDGGDALPHITGIELDLVANTVTTPFGVAAVRREIAASEGQTLTGPWNGVQWKLEKPELEVGAVTLVRFSLGRLKETGRGILLYEAKEVRGRQPTTRARYLLTYDLKATPAAKEAAAEPASIYLGLRGQALKVTARDIGLEVTPGSSEPYGILMETGLARGVATLVSLADGTASLYLSNGGGIIGGAGHDSVRKAAKGFVRLAKDYMQKMDKTTSYPMPSIGMVRFYALTPSGVFTFEASENDLGYGRSDLSKLFHEGQKVITELRLTQNK